MKTPKIIMLLSFFWFAGQCFAVDDDHSLDWGPYHFYEGISIDFEGGSLIVLERDTDDVLFEITEKDELFVRGEHVKTSPREKRLLREFYGITEDMVDEARQLGYKGAKIGVKGAKMAAKAVGGVFEILFSGFDETVIEEFEQKMEEESELLEQQAEKLEIEAERLEELEAELEKVYEKLEKEVEELKELELKFKDE